MVPVEMDSKHSRRNHLAKDVAHLLLLLGAGVLAAIFCVAMAVSYDRRPTSYALKNVLLAPDLLQRQAALQGSATSRLPGAIWTFDRVECRIAGRQGRSACVKTVPLDDYQRFYDLLSEERSLSEPAPRSSSPKLSLVLILRPEERYSALYEPQAFQELQILERSLFRIQLHEGRSKRSSWAYFRRPQVLEEAMRLFMPGAS